MTPEIDVSVQYGGGAPVYQRLLAILLLLTLNLGVGSSHAADAPIRILALGDSLTAGLGLTQEQAIPAQLEKALRARGLNVAISNAGVSGDTSTGGLARLDWALADQPHAVILELGANDGLRAIDPQLTRANLDKILSTLKARNIPVLLTGMVAPPNLGKDYATAFDAIYPDLAQRYGVLFYPFFLDGVATDPKLNQEDGIHPNPKGVAVIVERLLPYVIRLIEGSKP
ncbi:MAG: arylesterase [Gammaproteobacteria bacterium]